MEQENNKPQSPENIKFNNSKRKETTTKVLIALLSVAIISIGILVFIVLDKSNQLSKVEKEVVYVVDEKENLKREFSSLLDDYSDLETNNDSLNQEIYREKERIQSLIQELDKEKKYNVGVRKKYENELESLRKIMRNYVVQVDSLDQLNKQLLAENTLIKEQHTKIKTQIDDVVGRNDELEQVIQGASVLKTSPVNVRFLNRRDKDTKKSSKIQKLQISFTIIENEIAEAGPKTLFLRIINPEGFVLSSGETFEYNEKEMNYSASRSIIYENQNLDISIFYEVAEQLIIGKYILEIYTYDNKIAESFFNIEK